MALHLFPHKTNLDFMGKRWVGFTISIALTLFSIGLVLTHGLNLGIDFTGGILMEIHTEKPADLGSLRDTLNRQNFGEISLQTIGANTQKDQDVMIRVQSSANEDQAKTVAKIKEVLGATELGRMASTTARSTMSAPPSARNWCRQA